MANKHKRGHKFIVKETWIAVILERVKETGEYFVNENGKYNDYWPDELKEDTKLRTPIKSKANKPTEEKKFYQDSLNKFFEAQITMLPERCEECGIKFTGYGQSELRGLIAHILPKSPNSGFPEVSTHPLNRMFLGTKCGCHAKFDNNNGEGRSKMKVYPIALARFNKFKHNLSTSRLIKAFTYLNVKWQ